VLLLARGEGERRRGRIEGKEGDGERLLLGRSR
jgi:hypothetical protein